MRNCVLVVRRDASRDVVLRSARSRGQLAVRTEHIDGPAGGLCEPGHLWTEFGCTAAVFFDGDVADAGCDRLDALGDVPWSLYGPLHDQWRRLMAPGKGDQVRR